MNARVIWIAAGAAAVVAVAIAIFFAWPHLFERRGPAADPVFGEAPILRLNPDQHGGTIYRAGITADGDLMVTAGNDNVVKLWRVSDMQLVSTLRVPISNDANTDPSAGMLRAVDISPNGAVIAAAGQTRTDGTYRLLILDTVTGEIITELLNAPGVIADVAFSLDGQFLAAGLDACEGDETRVCTSDNGLWVWNTTDWSASPYRDDDYTGRINGIGFNAAGDLFTTSFDRRLRRYTTEERASPEFRPTPVPARPAANSYDTDMRPYDLDISPDGQSILVGYLNNQSEEAPAAVTLYRASDLSPARDFDLGGLRADNGGTVQATLVNGVSFSGNGDYVYANIVQHQAGDQDKKVRRWSVRDPNAAHVDYGLCTSQTINQILPYQNNGAIFVSNDPCISRVGDDGQRLDVPRAIYDIDNNNLPANDPGLLLVSETGDRIYLAQDNEGNGITFDLIERRLTSNPAPSDPSRNGVTDRYVQLSGGTEMQNWCCSGESPSINNHPITLDQNIRTWSTDVAPNGDFAVLGTSGGLSRYNRDGTQAWPTYRTSVPRRVNITPNQMTIVALYRDGVMRWHSAETGEVLLNLFIYEDGENWAMWTPAGYFDSSVGGDRILGWHLNQGRDEAPSWLPISRYANVFRRPDIINQVIESIRDGVTTRGASELLAETGSPERANQTIRQNAPPITHIVDSRISRDGTQMTVTFIVTSPSGAPVTNLLLDVSGRPLAPERGRFPTGQRLHRDVPITRRDTYVGVRAENRHGRGEVSTASLQEAFFNTFDVPQPEETETSQNDPFDNLPPFARRPVLHALVVGIEYRYRQRGNLNELCCAVDDAEEFSQFLLDQKSDRRTSLFSDVQITELTDREATLATLENELSRLSDLEGNNVILIFLAGHGVTDRGYYNFIPYGVNPEAGQLENIALTGPRITQALRDASVPVILMMDTCNSQGALERSFLNDIYNLQKNIFTFSSSRDGQASIEQRSWGNGAFTRALMHAARGEAPGVGENGVLTYAELGPYLREEVRRETEGRQVPQYFAWGPEGANPQANLFAVRRAPN